MGRAKTTFRSRVISELRDKHRERSRLEAALGEVLNGIREIEETAPSLAAEYAKDPTGLDPIFAALEDIVKSAKA